MAKIKDVTMEFPASPSPDVVGYKLYIEESPNPVTHQSQSFDLGNNTTVVLNDVVGEIDGIYNIGVAAVDDAGNESDFSLLADVPLDFVPPQPPGTGVISYG